MAPPPSSGSLGASRVSSKSCLLEIHAYQDLYRRALHASCTDTSVSSETLLPFTTADNVSNRFGWFVGHVTLLLCTLRYGLSYITFHPYSAWARYSYRTAFVAAAATYGIVVYKAYRARARAGSRQQGGPLALAGDENVQYLGLSSTIHASFTPNLMYISPSNGIGLAFRTPDSTRPPSFHGLLCLPCGDLHPHQHSADYCRSTTISRRCFTWGPPSNEGFTNGR